MRSVREQEYLTGENLKVLNCKGPLFFSASVMQSRKGQCSFFVFKARAHKLIVLILSVVVPSELTL
jgi:hypothetical protein